MKIRITFFENKSGVQVALFLSVLIVTTLIVVNPIISYANPSGISFYSPSSLPPGIKSSNP
ncbi:hypothetical protein DYY65_06365 [Nitrososphaera sp. AFS]|nr:hypothetical protein [Nitrososphaera sp. AFS]